METLRRPQSESSMDDGAEGQYSTVQGQRAIALALRRICKHIRQSTRNEGDAPKERPGNA